MHLPFDPTIPFLGIYLRDISSEIQNNICTSLFTVKLFVLSKYWEHPKCSSLTVRAVNCGTDTQQSWAAVKSEDIYELFWSDITTGYILSEEIRLQKKCTICNDLCKKDKPEINKNSILSKNRVASLRTEMRLYRIFFMKFLLLNDVDVLFIHKIKFNFKMIKEKQNAKVEHK